LQPSSQLELRTSIQPATPGRPHLIFGRVHDGLGHPVRLAPVKVTVEGNSGRSLPIRAWTDHEGWWIVNLADARSASHPDQPLNWRTDDHITLQIADLLSHSDLITPSGPQFLGPPERFVASVDHPVIHSIFPNPFNSRVTIEYSLPDEPRHRPQLLVYSVLGQVVKSLNVSTDSGVTHQVTWDGTDTVGRAMSSGIYLVKMGVGRHYVVRKVMCLR